MSRNSDACLCQEIAGDGAKRQFEAWVAGWEKGGRVALQCDPNNMKKHVEKQ